jgi:hypothetical protein
VCVCCRVVISSPNATLGELVPRILAPVRELSDARLVLIADIERRLGLAALRAGTAGEISRAKDLGTAAVSTLPPRCLRGARAAASPFCKRFTRWFVALKKSMAIVCRTRSSTIRCCRIDLLCQPLALRSARTTSTNLRLSST